MADPKKFVVFAYSSGPPVPMVFYHKDVTVLKTIRSASTAGTTPGAKIVRLNDPNGLLSSFVMQLVEITVKGDQLHEGSYVTSAVAYAAP